MQIETSYYIAKYVLPAALDLLPARMSSPQAKAMLLAIGLQESKFDYRQQVGGPAHGYWQFEKAGGVRGVLGNKATAPLIVPIIQLLDYRWDETTCYNAITHNDVLACAFARLLLWTVPGALPQVNEPDKGWSQYLSGWRPGKPHRATWNDYFAEAWRIILEE